MWRNLRVGRRDSDKGIDGNFFFSFFSLLKKINKI